jgi:DNA replication and repair protein RecF
MSWIKNIQITNFRNYDTMSVDISGNSPVVLYGANGAGKTNILEAVSLLSPGRGLRSAKTSEIQRKDSNVSARPWAISAKVESRDYGETRLGTGSDVSGEKRIVRINGETQRGQNALSEYMSCLWLTPQMDRLFIDASSARRRFYDRLVFTFDPAHSGRVARYENVMRQRSKILKTQDSPDPTWLNGLERTMAETGVAIAAARLEFLSRLQLACDQAPTTQESLFPRARLSLSGTIEELLRQNTALNVEDMFAYQLAETRKIDAISGGAATGIHKTDLITHYHAKDMPADQCSTGEQKALLIGIILAHGMLIQSNKAVPPVILLDEVAAHLDKTRRGALYERLCEAGVQFWLTGTDKNLFDDIAHKAFCFEVKQGTIHTPKSIKLAC